MYHCEKWMLSVLLIGVCLLAGCSVKVANTESNPTHMASSNTSPENLAVLWTSGDPYVAHKVCFMYTHNAKKQNWFSRVQLIVWGPSAKLLAEDVSLQDYVKRMIADGVEVKACKACADSYGVSNELAALGIEVRYMGGPLTEFLKAPDWAILTF